MVASLSRVQLCLYLANWRNGRECCDLYGLCMEREEGQATIQLNSQLDPDTDIYVRDIIKLLDTTRTSMTVLMDGCLFNNNNNHFRVIANIGSDMNLL